MKIFLQIGGIRFRFDSDYDMIVEESLAPFSDPQQGPADVSVRVLHDALPLPRPKGVMVGEDLLMEYYRDDDRLLCFTRGGQNGYLACCVCSADQRELVCRLRFPPGSPADTLGNLLRMIPLRQLLLQRRVLFLHASQIALGPTGILFSAPSQTGKTTQAKLWSAHRSAQILCNDRTLTDGHRTYGFPVDGSEPVLSGEARALGAIVLLEQAPENTVRRLRLREALPRLMAQLVIDVWNPDARTAAADQLLELGARIPIYLLRCTPDENAVVCLEQQLRKDGVITNA